MEVVSRRGLMSAPLSQSTPRLSATLSPRNILSPCRVTFQQRSNDRRALPAKFSFSKESRSTSTRGSRLSCRAVVEDPPAPSAKQTESLLLAPESDTGGDSVPSCCSKSSTDESIALSSSSPAFGSSSEGFSPASEGSNEWVSRALLTGALLAVPVAVLALKPELLPFDIDDVQDWLDEAVYYASHEINRAVNSQLGDANPLAPGLLSLVFGAGVVTSFAPCTLSVLPLTIGYIAGFNSSSSSGNEKGNQSSVVANAMFFALGLATTFSALGITVALAGKAYGQMGPGLPIAVSGVTMFMGLNLLGLVRFEMPSLFANFDAKEAAASLPVAVQMYLGGMTFALLASPCSTPVLASLLGYVASSEDVVVGFALLLAYTFGRVMPILVAASFTGSMKQLLSLRQYSRWVNPASGALLLGIGTFSLLNRVFPEATAMAMGMSHM